MPVTGSWTPFRNRRDAGRMLAAKLDAYAGRDDVIVLGLPRGGVPVAYEVALHLGAPLDVLPVRKLGVPGRPELAFGAVALGGIRVLNPEVLATAGLDPAVLAQITEREQAELQRRERAYRGETPAVAVAGRTALLVDDGLATGATMRAAVRAARAAGAIPVVAVPVAPRDVCGLLARCAEAVVCLLTPAQFGAVGQWYGDFNPTSDEEVRRLLQRAALR